jgi:hypothetical protein
LADFFSRREEVLVLETDLLDAFSAPFNFSPALDLLLLIGNKKLGGACLSLESISMGGKPY